MTEFETLKRKAEDISVQSPRTPKQLKLEEPQDTRPMPAADSDSRSAGLTREPKKGNITIIHTHVSGSRTQWTFPRAYLIGRTRASSPPSTSSTKDAVSIDAELDTSNLNGSFTSEAVAIFYHAITTESTVSPTGHTLHEYCQIHALSQFFEVQNIFRDGEISLLRHVMTDDAT